MKINKINLLVMALFVVPIFIASFRILDVGPDYYSYKYIYDNGISAEPLFYGVSLLLRGIGMPFEVFHLILSLLAFYWFVRFLILNRVEVPIIVFSATLFYVLHLSSHWRTGLALSLICYLTSGHSDKRYFTSFFPAMVHVSALVAMFVRLLANKTVIFIFVFIILNFFIVDFIELVGAAPFRLIGRENFFHAIINVADGEENYLHRSLWYWNNFRLYFVVIMLYFLWPDWIRKTSELINLAIIGNLAFLLFLFNAYISQKTYLLFLPLQLAAAGKISSKQRRIVAMFLVISVSLVDLLERYIERL